MRELVIGTLRLPARVVRRAIFAAMLAGVLVVAVGLALPRRFASGFAIVPQVSDAGNSGLSSIASQLGVNLGTIDLTQTPLFYSELLGSKAFMLSLVGAQYRVHTPDGERDTLLYDWLGAPGATPAQRRERGGVRLRDRIGISASPRSGIVRFTVAVTDSALARQVATRALWQVDSFNVRIKQSQARAERIFLEQRLDSAGLVLRRAESALVAFDERNRAGAMAPALRTERERIERDLRVLEGVYQLLRQQLERTRIDEVRNTPVVTVVEEVRSPAWPESRFLLLKSAAAGAIVAVLWLAAYVAVIAPLLQGVLSLRLVRRARRLLAGDDHASGAPTR